jgi:hypothetical protein
MAVMPRVLLDQVDQNPSQAGRLAVGPGAPGRSGQVRRASRSRPPSACASTTRVRERTTASCQSAWSGRAQSRALNPRGGVDYSRTDPTQLRVPRVLRVRITSTPVRSAVRRRTVNEPLGATVRLLPAKRRTLLSLMATRQS